MTVEEIVFDMNQILDILPHRYPFLLVDRVTHLDLENNNISGYKNVTINEPFFVGHFPQVPIMPGVLILEAMAQVGGILIHQKGYDKKLALLLTVNGAKFRKPVVPGDKLELSAQLEHIGSKGGRAKTKAMVDGKVVSQAEIGFALIDKPVTS